MGEGAIRRWWFAVLAVAAGILLAGMIRESAAGVLLPLLAAYLGARLLRPSALWLSRRCPRIPEKGFCAVYAVLVCGALLFLIASLSGRMAGELWALTDELPEAAAAVSELFVKLYERLPEGLRVGDMAELLPSLLGEAASAIGGAAAGMLASAVQKAPGGLLSVLVAAVGLVWLTADPDGVSESFRSLLPGEDAAPEKENAPGEGNRAGNSYSPVSSRLGRMLGRLSDAVVEYVRAGALLTLLTFGELAVGLSLLRVKNALAGSLLIALIDALPVFGAGVVLAPWALWCFLTHETGRGIGLLLLLAAVWTVRQVAEPRIVGKAAGLHPFTALICLFVGWKLGGVGGMIAAPVLVMAGKKGEES